MADPKVSDSARTRNSGADYDIKGTTALVALFGRAIAFQALNNGEVIVKVRSLDLRHTADVPRSAWIRLLRKQGKLTESGGQS